MLTHVAQTSILQYRAMRDAGDLTEKQAAIMEVIQPGRDYSLQEISVLANLQINTVSGRCNELKKMGRLEVGAKRPCSITGVNVGPLRLPKVQGALF